MKTYKGFDSNLQCRGYRYEVGKTYTTDENVELCKNGFHAISDDVSPLSVFDYYPPSINGKPSRYCEVDVEGDVKNDGSKVCSSKITIGAEIGIPGIVKDHVEWVKEHLIDDKEHKSSNTGDHSSASNTGNYSSASNTGYQSSASNTGDQSSASNTGNYSSAEVSGKDSVAIATGLESKARGSLGCAIVVAERGEWNGETYPLIGICSAIVDGVNIKADTWYTAKDGKLVEVVEED